MLLFAFELHIFDVLLPAPGYNSLKLKAYLSLCEIRL